MKHVVVFAHYSVDSMDCYANAADEANAWLAAHPDAIILDAYTNMSAGVVRESQYSEYSITLMVEMPEGGVTTQEG